jgi:hypothetical protein
MYRATRKSKQHCRVSGPRGYFEKEAQRKWVAIEIVMSSEKIDKFKVILQQSRSNLMLVLKLSSVWVMVDLFTYEYLVSYHFLARDKNYLTSSTRSR